MFLFLMFLFLLVPKWHFELYIFMYHSHWTTPYYHKISLSLFYYLLLSVFCHSAAALITSLCSVHFPPLIIILFCAFTTVTIFTVQFHFLKVIIFNNIEHWYFIEIIWDKYIIAKYFRVVSPLQCCWFNKL